MEGRPLSPFQQMIQKDRLSVFLNIEEYGETHRVEGREISVVIAPDQDIPIGGGYKLGISESSIVLYAASEDLPKRKTAGESISVDGREYTVDKWHEQMGISELHLSQTVSY